MAEPGKIQFERVATGRQFEKIVAEIRKAIVRGDLKPGEKLPTEPKLAAQFGVSRSALREAQKVLELSGYLEVRRGYGGGTFVSRPDIEEFSTVPAPPIPSMDLTPQQVLEVRLAVEPIAARLAATSRLPEVVGIRQVIQSHDPTDERPARFLAVDVDFHIAVANASANPVFISLVRNLRSAMHQTDNRLVQSLEWRTQHLQDHESITQSIEAGDAEASENGMQLHLTREWEIDG